MLPPDSRGIVRGIMARRARRRSPNSHANPPPHRAEVPDSDESARDPTPARISLPVASLILATAAMIAYLPAFGGAFLFDDAAEITQNETITSLRPWSRFFDNNTRPVASLSFALNYAVGGLDPIGYHVVNFIIHLLAGMTLFAILRRVFSMLRSDQTPDPALQAASASSLALVIALFWLLHPLQTQAVTYIVQRTESLAALFCLVALYAFHRAATAAERNSPRRAPRSRFGWSIVAAGACALGMATKQTALVMPILLFLFDWIVIAPRQGTSTLHRWPVHLLLAAAWIVPLAGGTFAAAVGADPYAATGFAFKGISPFDYLKTQAGVILHYLRLTLWPHPLCLDYDWPVARTPMQFVPQGLVILALMGTAAITALRRHALGFALLAFLILLAPTSSFIPIKDVIFEHRMYLPLAPIIAIVVVALHRAMRRPWRRARIPLVVLATACLMTLTFLRNRDYRDPVTMWTDVTVKQPTNARAFNNLGNALSLAGRDDDARRAFETALRLDPNHADALYNLGRLLHDAGRIPDAIALYRRAQAAAPHEIESSIQLGNALTDRNDLTGAAAEFERALAAATPRTPRRLLARAHFNLANTRARQNRIEDAQVHYTAALHIKPDYAPAHRGLAWIAERQGRLDDAIAHYQAALTIDPSDRQARASLDALTSQAPARLTPSP